MFTLCFSTYINKTKTFVITTKNAFTGRLIVCALLAGYINLQFIDLKLIFTET